jgi:hypothetical protein
MDAAGGQTKRRSSHRWSGLVGRTDHSRIVPHGPAIAREQIGLIVARNVPDLREMTYEPCGAAVLSASP